MEKSQLESIKSSGDFASVRGHLSAVNADALSPRDFSALGKVLKGLPDEGGFRIAYLGNFTLDLLPAYVSVLGAKAGLLLRSHLGGYNQHYQEVLQEGSPLRAFRPNLVFLALSMRVLQPEIFDSFGALSKEGKRTLRERVVAHVKEWAALASGTLDATLLICNFSAPFRPSVGIADLKEDYGEAEFYMDLNRDLVHLFKGESRIHLFDIDRLAAAFGKDRVGDAKLYYMAKIEWSERFLPRVAEEMVRYLKPMKGLGKKCLVLDMDNTLWGGIVGEDGPLGIKVGQGNAVSEAYLDFQHRIKALKDRGIILAACSKNNPEDVWQVFEARPEMPLKKADFSALEINWEPKHENLRRIARSLNIGTDSLVFIDDNPAECSLICQTMPEVKTLLLPPDPAEFPAFLERLDDFEKIRILDEDRVKTLQYEQNRLREDQKGKVGDLRGYLESLETEVAIRPAAPADLGRAHELFHKTNQFNLTTIRYSMGDVEAFLGNGRHRLGLISAKDRFGDLGIIALYLLEPDGRVLRIDSFLMSCRAMGRGIESAIANHIKRDHLAAVGFSVLHAAYLPTAKNKPAENFYEEQGLTLAEQLPDGGKRYTLEAGMAKPVDCSWIKAAVAG